MMAPSEQGVNPAKQGHEAEALRMNREQEIVAQTAVRRALLANGYTPLANNDKRCMLPGWPALHVDEALIERWSDAWKYRATGVRLDNGLVMIDFDIDDAGMLDEIVNRLGEADWAVLERCPVRFGKGAKQAWFARVEQAFPRWASAAFWRPGEGADDADPMHRVEVFGGSSPRQAGAYGAHTIGGDGKVAVRYEWLDGRGLVEVPLVELPLVDEALIERLCRVANEALAEAGWTRVTSVRAGRTDAGEVFDLHDGMVFVTAEGEMGLEELRDRVQAGVLRLSASWLEGDSAVNLSRCIASARHDGGLQILETADHVLHRPMDDELGRKAKPGSSGLDKLAALREKHGMGIFKAPETRAEGEAPEERPVEPSEVLEQIVASMCAGLVYMPSADRCVVEIGRGPEAAMGKGNARDYFAPMAVPFIGKKGAVTKINPFDVWLESDARRDVVGFRFDPTSEEQIIELPDGGRALNLHKPLRREGVVADEGAVEDFETFMRHLLPDDWEREWFYDWLAAKVQRPWVPNCGVIMVTPTHGTGRGTLFDGLRDVMGPAHTRAVEALQLLGGQGQGQYTEWLEQSLLVTCEEVLAGDDAAGQMTWKRREMYERLKGLIDPRARMKTIVCKGRPNYEGMVYASFLLATNNMNALPLLTQDRRIAVLKNTRVKLNDAPEANAAAERLRAPDGLPGWRAEAGVAIWSWLMQRPVQWDTVRDAPETTGREAMIEANEGDLEEVLAGVLDEVPGDFLLNTDLQERLSRALTARGLRDGLRHWWQNAQSLLMSQGERYGWHRMDVRQKTGGGNRHTIYVRAGAGMQERLEVWASTPVAERGALYALGSDLNATQTKLAAKLASKGWGVVEGKRDTQSPDGDIQH